MTEASDCKTGFNSCGKQKEFVRPLWYGTILSICCRPPSLGGDWSHFFPTKIVDNKLMRTIDVNSHSIFTMFPTITSIVAYIFLHASLIKILTVKRRTTNHLCSYGMVGADTCRSSFHYETSKYSFGKESQSTKASSTWYPGVAGTVSVGSFCIFVDLVFGTVVAHLCRLWTCCRVWPATQRYRPGWLRATWIYDFFYEYLSFEGPWISSRCRREC